MIDPYRKAVAAFLTPLSVYLVAIVMGATWRDGLDVLVAAAVTLATVFLVPNADDRYLNPPTER